MPLIKANGRVMQDGTKMIQYTDTVGPSYVTYTLENEQELLVIANKGIKPITFIVGTTTAMLNPGQSQKIETNFTSFQVKSSEGIQQFEVRMDEVGTEGIANIDVANLDSRMDSFSSQLAQTSTQINERIDNIIVTPAEGITEQEILDARQGMGSLGANITTVKNNYATLDEYLEARKKINEIAELTDFTIKRGTFSTNALGDVSVIENATNFAYFLFPENIKDLQFSTTITSSRFYLITGYSETAIDAIMVQGSSPGKGYKFLNDGTTIGSQTVNITPSETMAIGDVARIHRDANGLTFYKNEVEWFKVSNADYPTVIKNRFGMLITAGTINKLLCTAVKFNEIQLDTVSPKEKIGITYDYVTNADINPYSLIKWGTLGDSLTANNGVSGEVDYGINYRLQVQNLLGIGAVNNKSVTGSAIARKASLANDAYAMHLQYTTLDADCNIVTVLGGTNDYRGAGADGVPIGVKGSVNNYEFYGALKTLIEGLITKFPSGKIVFMTPPRRTNDTTPNQQGHVLKDYVTAIKDMCSDYSIPVLDLYNDGGVNIINSSTLQTDGLHLNQLGYEMISRKIAKFIERV